MPKRALIEHRPWLLGSMAAAIAYYFLSDNQIGELYLIMLKGAGVGLLAAYTWHRASGVDGALIATALVLAALADMALELWFEIGGALFAASHAVAVGLYLRNLRPQTTPSQKALAAALLIGSPAISYLVSGDPLIAVYGLTLGAMASAAWMSRFPRYRVGIGAVLFVVSDWLIFSRMGTFDLQPLPDLLIWPLYYGGMLLIATGVVQTLRADHEG